MTKIVWDQTYGVGVRLIDTQHQKLFSILNKLDEAANQDRVDDELMEGIIFDLKAYVEFHFGEEKKYFNEFNYPDKASHMREHREYIEKIKEFHADYLKQEKGLSQKIVKYVEDWIKNHIKTIDTKYTKCFNDNGLS